MLAVLALIVKTERKYKPTYQSTLPVPEPLHVVHNVDNHLSTGFCLQRKQWSK